ncbi:MAG: hypothetical protein Q4D05_07730 [Acinetobacter sp.]|nr:hypothetical protein [Acinetobacter sp.]
MSVNRYQNYLMVLFEDNAYKDLFLGFDFAWHKQIELKPVYQGFDDVYLQLTYHNSLICKELAKYPTAYVLALIDGDLDSQSESKIEQLKNALTQYQDRIFIIGSKYEAEHIKRAIIEQGKWKTVGQKLGQSCKNEACALWQNEMLAHNQAEITRLKQVFDLWGTS